MKRIKALNGYTIYQTTSRDKEYTPGEYVVYCSSDVREFGREYSYPEYEGIDSLEIAEELCVNDQFARAKEIVERTTTAATYEEIFAVEAMLSAR